MAWRRAVGFVAVVLAAVVLGALVRQAPRVLSRLPVFEVVSVRLEGARYLTEDAAREAAGIGAETNLWHPREPWIQGLEEHPLVRTASVRRVPPGTLAFEIEERAPVAFVEGAALNAVDRNGIELPIDPTRAAIDLPVVRVSRPDSSVSLEVRIVAEELSRLEVFAPDVFAVVSEAVYEDGQITLRLGDSLTRLRYSPPLVEVRLREAMAAMNDWAARFDQGPPREVDLRYEDQIVIRASS